jgi:hypothetical protein
MGDGWSVSDVVNFLAGMTTLMLAFRKAVYWLGPKLGVLIKRVKLVCDRTKAFLTVLFHWIFDIINES